MSNHEIKSSPGAGLGIFATRPHSRGDLVLAEAPLLSLTHTELVSRAPDIERLFAALNPVKQAAYLSLYTTTADNPPLAHWLDILFTNGFQLERYGPNSTGEGVFELAARFNHSCTPNTAWSWNNQTGLLTVHAVRDVANGEELTITYIDQCAARAKRRRRLREDWGFWCKCPACDLNTPNTPHVQSLRETIARREGVLRSRVEKCARRLQQNKRVSKRKIIRLLGELRALVYLLKATGLVGNEIANWYDLGSILCGCSDEVEVYIAREWTVEALKATECVKGAEHPDVEGLRNRLERVERKMREPIRTEQRWNSCCTQ